MIEIFRTKRIIKHFGYLHQLHKKLPEELCELREAIAENDIEHIREEIVDVWIVLTQIIGYLGWIGILKIANKKIKRTLERIYSGYYDKDVVEDFSQKGEH